MREMVVLLQVELWIKKYLELAAVALEQELEVLEVLVVYIKLVLEQLVVLVKVVEKLIYMGI